MEDFIIKSHYAEIKEIKNISKNNENMLRVYCYHKVLGIKREKTGFVLQIRTYGPITDRYSKTAKPRNMVANIHLNYAELESILEYAKKEIETTIDSRPVFLILEQLTKEGDDGKENEKRS